MVRLTFLTGADYRRMRWKNGGGWTTELAVEAGEGGDGAEFLWRISIAEIEVDGDFSRFPGVDRSILVLAGEGMALTIAGAPAVELRAGEPARAFSGDVAVGCRLLNGPTRDFNVMTRRGRCTHGVVRVSAGASVGNGFVYVVRGEARVGGMELGAGESLRIDAELGDAPTVIEGEATLVVVHLQR